MVLLTTLYILPKEAPSHVRTRRPRRQPPAP